MSVKNIKLFIRMLNIITGAGLITLSIFALINVLRVLTIYFFLIPSPIFVGIFGFCLIAAELKIKIILKHFGFLNNLLGRGIFNIYLSSTTFWFLIERIQLAWTVATLLFLAGVIYIVFYFGWGEKLNSQHETTLTDEKESKSRVRQNLI